MAFRFPLAAVLRVRESVEKREELALQTIQLQAARLRHLIEELTADIARTHDTIERAVQQSVQANRLQAMLREVNTKVEARVTLFQTLQTLEQQRLQQLKLYQDAYIARQMITNLLTQGQKAYERDQARTQQKNLDDIFISHLQQN